VRSTRRDGRDRSELHSTVQLEKNRGSDSSEKEY